MTFEELQAKMATYGALVDQFAGTIAEMDKLKKEIQAGVKEHGESVEYDGVTATLRKPYVRTSWDSKGLEGYAKYDPKILEFRKQTNVGPSVSVRVA
jgi:hypothetical protein